MPLYMDTAPRLGKCPESLAQNKTPKRDGRLGRKGTAARTGGLASMTRDAIGSRSVLERVGWRAEERIARVIGGPLTFGARHARVGRHVGAGLLPPPADQPPVLGRPGKDGFAQTLLFDAPELPTG